MTPIREHMPKFLFKSLNKLREQCRMSQPVQRRIWRTVTFLDQEYWNELCSWMQNSVFHGDSEGGWLLPRQEAGACPQKESFTLASAPSTLQFKGNECGNQKTGRGCPTHIVHLSTRDTSHLFCISLISLQPSLKERWLSMAKEGWSP